MNNQFQNQISDYIFKKQKEKGILNHLCAHYVTLVTESLQSTMPTNIQVQRSGGKLSRIENAAKIAQAVVLHYFRSHDLIYSLRTFGADYQNIDDNLKYLLEKKRRFRKSKNKNTKPKFDNQKVQEYLMNEIQSSKPDNFISMLIQGHNETYIKRSKVNGYRISCVLLSKKNNYESSQLNSDITSYSTIAKGSTIDPSYSLSLPTSNKRNISNEIDSDSQQHKRRRRKDSSDNYFRQSERSPSLKFTPYNYFKIHRSPDSNLDPIELTFDDEEEEEESQRQEFHTRSVRKTQQNNYEYDYASNDNAQNSYHYKKKVVQKTSEEIVDDRHRELFDFEEHEEQKQIKQQTKTHNRNENHSHSESETSRTSRSSRSESHSGSSSHSDSETHSRSGSHSGSSSHSRSESHSDSETHSRSGSHSDSETHSRSGSHSDSETHSRSGSHSDSETHSRSGSHSGSSSHSRTSSLSQTDDNDNDAAEQEIGDKLIADDDKSSKGSESERVVDSEQQSLSYLSMSGALSDSVYLSGPPDMESDTKYKNKSEIKNANKETDQEKSAQSHSIFDSSFDINNLNFSQPDPRFIKKDTDEKSNITIDSTIIESKSEIANEAEKNEIPTKNEESKSEISIDIENSNDEIEHQNGIELADLIEEEEEEAHEQTIVNNENSVTPTQETVITPSTDTLEEKSEEENDE